MPAETVADFETFYQQIPLFCPKLQRLSVLGLHLGSVSLVRIGRLPQLRTLELENGTAESVTVFLDLIRQSPKLAELHFKAFNFFIPFKTITWIQTKGVAIMSSN
jgi:hypothetical protein